VPNLLSQYRRYLTNYESLLAYSLLGLAGGLASGLVVLAFELAIAEMASLWGVGDGGEDFESLPQWAWFALPAGGALLLGSLYSLLKPEDRETGIVHVISRMHSHYGALPVRNALLQFLGGAFALASGQSGGREGPGVHLGGAVNSLLGQRLGLPNNSLRVLIACGTAGGIAAAFQTPLAGVIFAMEVIIAGYSVVGFIPVMLAAVSASAISFTLSGSEPLFNLPAVRLGSLAELPIILLLGLCCGLAVAAFIRLIRVTANLGHWPVAARFAFAGCVTGALALGVPQILGIGYDSLQLILEGEMALSILLMMALCKLIATATSCGMGLPVGLIGPNLLIGACIGAALAIIFNHVGPGLESDPVLYVVIGMGATMGAVLNAPLAAILAVIELTHTVSIGMPAMLAIIVATLTNTVVFRQRSAHQTVLRQLQRAVPEDPVNNLLHHTDVSSGMDTRVVRVPTALQPQDLEPLLEFTPTWCLLEREGEDLYLVQGHKLLDWLKEQTPDEEGIIDLTGADIRRWSMAPVPVQATLRQAMDTMHTQTVEAACVYERSKSSGKRILHGVLTRDSIEKFTLSRL
jgi:H+/Cl- antiporter ClcA